MPSRTARIEWTGDFRTGRGTVSAGSGAFEAGCSFGSIFQDEPGTNPMEVLGLSLAMCFTGALAAVLARENISVGRISTEAQVRTEPSILRDGRMVKWSDGQSGNAGQGSSQESGQSEIRNPKSEMRGFTVAEIVLHVRAEVAGIDESALAAYAEQAKSICPVGLALGNVEITIETEMV